MKRLLVVASLLISGCAADTPTNPTPLPKPPSPTEPASMSLGFQSGVGTATVIAVVQNGLGDRIANVAVAFSTDGGSLSATSATTDKNGEARDVLTASAAAKVTAKAGSVTQTTIVAVQPTPPSIPIPPPFTPPPPVVTPPTPTPTPSPSYSVTMTATPSGVLTGTTSVLMATALPQNGAPAPAFYDWDCKGDGSAIVTTAAPTNMVTCAYPNAGTINSRVTVRSGTTLGVGSVAVTVSAPTIAISCDSPSLGTGPTVTAHCAVSATVSGATIDSTLISQVDWGWGDGTKDTELTNIGAHPYSIAIQYFLTVTVHFTTGATATGSGSVTIKP